MFPQSEDAVYFRAIEGEFIRLRVTPLQFSPDDFKVAREWRAAGVPLELALAVLREKVEGQRAKGDEVKQRLSYYRRAILKGWEKRQALLAPAARPLVPAVDTTAELESLAASLPSSLIELAAQIRDMTGDPEAVESRLGELERQALEVYKANLSGEERIAVQREVEESLGDLRHRLPAEQLSQVIASLERQVLRERSGLPVFSLFAR